MIKKYEGKNMHMDYLLYELKFEYFFSKDGKYK